MFISLRAFVEKCNYRDLLELQLLTQKWVIFAMHEYRLQICKARQQLKQDSHEV